MPRPSASVAATLPTCDNKAVSKEAASPMGDGNIVPLFVKPCKPEEGF